MGGYLSGSNKENKQTAFSVMDFPTGLEQIKEENKNENGSDNENKNSLNTSKSKKTPSQKS
jgi:hypothetical protein